MLKFMKYSLAALLTLMLTLVPLASAHATIVLGTLSSEPAAPQPSEPFVIRLKLVDPVGTPTEDAVVLLEVRPTDAGEESAPLVSAEFEEIDSAGVYEATVTLPEAGDYALLLRDKTYRQEEARALLSFTLGEGPLFDEENRDFFFPPTVIGGSLTTWLIWLIGLPLVAGVVVTVLVLRNSDGGKANTQKA